MTTTSSTQNIVTLQKRAQLLRRDSIRATTAGGSGHPTSCMSAAEIVAALFFEVMHFDATNPHDPNNDRCIMSKGHAIPVIYAAWKQLGVISDAELLSLRAFDSVLEGHPTPRWPYNEAATGSLGQGLAVGVGMALAARHAQRSYKTYVIMGDGECAEGSVWEAAELASKYQLNNLVGIVDVNRLGQSDQTLLGHDMATYHARFSAFGWETLTVDGHNMAEILTALERAKTVTNKPLMILAQTFKGHGLPESDNKENMHGKPFTKDELSTVLEHFPDAPELVASKVTTKLSAMPRPTIRFSKKTENYTKMLDTKMMATRKAFGLALQDLGSAEPLVVALDADVKNSTYTDLFEKSHADRFFECWVAEQAMMSIATGFQLRGFIPFAATFSSFLSRAYDQIRMAGIGKNALRIMGSHAGVSIGQDGPSQMGLEDIALLRAVPESIVLYPSDSVSTFALVELMTNYYEGVSYIRTTRAETPHLYDEKTTFKLGGSHILRESKNDVVVIVAAGITLHEALKAHVQLAAEGISVAVIDAYSIKPLDVATITRVAKNAQNRIITVEDHYQAGGLGEAVAAAAVGQGIACTMLAVPGVSRSGKPEELLAYANIDADAIIRAVKAQK